MHAIQTLLHRTAFGLHYQHLHVAVYVPSLCRRWRFPTELGLQGSKINWPDTQMASPVALAEGGTSGPPCNRVRSTPDQAAMTARSVDDAWSEMDQTFNSPSVIDLGTLNLARRMRVGAVSAVCIHACMLVRRNCCMCQDQHWDQINRVAS